MQTLAGVHRSEALGDVLGKVADTLEIGADAQGGLFYRQMSVAPEPGLAATLDRGRVPGLRRGPLQDAAAAVLDALAAVGERGRAA